jgi:hypothetical protein
VDLKLLASALYVRHNGVVEMSYRVRFTQAARRHKVGRHHVYHVMASVEPTQGTRPSGETELTWEGPTADGWPLTVIGVLVPTTPAVTLLIVHVMPVYRAETEEGS